MNGKTRGGGRDNQRTEEVAVEVAEGEGRRVAISTQRFSKQVLAAKEKVKPRSTHLALTQLPPL